MNPAFQGSDCEGRLIDERFRLLHRLGGTERSSVFLTEFADNPVQRTTIKLMPVFAVDRQAYMARLKTAEDLSSPHLVRLLHAGHCELNGEELLYTVTEYAEELLSEILPQRALTPEEAGAMLTPVLDALSYLHGKGLVHGHLKPSNLLVVENRLKLSVDGIQSAGSTANPFSQEGACGPPEAATGKLFPAADVWSLGVLLVESLTQQPPIWERSGGREPVVPASLPQPFLGIAKGCLHIEPSQRCTIAEIRARLAPSPAAELHVTPVEPRAASTEKETKQFTLRFKILAAAVLVLLVAVAILAFGHRHTQPAASLPSTQPVAVPPVARPHAPVQGAHALMGSVVKGSVAYRALPDASRSAIDTIQGHVHVAIRVQVDADGKVSEATIASPGPSRYFAKLALKAAQQWQFTPAKTGNHAVDSTWLLKFQFGQDATVVTPEETSP
ncbi:MAG: TonB family protein [Terracidiphilus sp.]